MSEWTGATPTQVFTYVYIDNKNKLNSGCLTVGETVAGGPVQVPFRANRPLSDSKTRPLSSL